MIFPRRLRAWRLAAQGVLWLEYAALRLWHGAAILAAACGLAMLGLVPPGIPAPMLFLGVTVAAMLLLPRRLRGRLPPPTAIQAERRLERDSALPHRPFAVLRDVPATQDAAQAKLWQLHQARAAASLWRLKLSGPRVVFADADPFALRTLALLLLVAGVIAAGDRAPARLLAAFLPSIGGGGAAAPVLQAWIEPPAYTALPPIFLHAEGGRVTIPAGSKLNVSLTGGRFAPHLSGPDGTIKIPSIGDESWQATAVVKQSGSLTLSRLFRTVARWDLDVLPNAPPLAEFPQPPARAGASLETKLPWHVAQRWGVASLTATLRPAGHPDLPPILLPVPLPGTPKDAKGALLTDLSPNPYAGVDMEATLGARDVSGQPGESEAAHFKLPARDFKNGLARAIADLRRRMALREEAPEDAAADVEALALTPRAFAGHAGVFLNTISIAALLRANQAEAGIAEAQRRLWIVALALDGALPEMSQQALDDAMQALKRAMEESRQGKLSPTDLARQIEKLREALSQRLNDMAHQATKDGKLPKTDPRTHFSVPTIDHMLQALEKAMREGRTADAEQRMQELEKMLQKLDRAKILSPEEARQAEKAQKEAKKQSGAVQDLVQREAGLMDRAQARAPRAAPTPYQMLDRHFSASPPDADELEAQEESRGEDATIQRALRQAVEALKGALQGSGGQVPASLNDAGNDMQAATDALTAGEEPVAHSAEARAIEDLRKGGKDMQRQREANQQLAVVPGARQSGEQGAEEGSESGDDDGSEHDPLGRPLKQGVGGRAADDNSVHVPDEMEKLRSREIQEELRRRGADRERRREELDYIDRLLKPF